MGYYEANDGDGATYLIRLKKDEDVENDKNIIKILSDLVAEKIKNNILKFHAVAKSYATYVIEFTNGKNLLIDTGDSTQWTDIKNAIDSLKIKKFDYFIITHTHNDHTGNIQNFINNYDFNDCKCWIGMKPDFINYGNCITDKESSYNDVITLLKNNNINPVVPTNNSYFEVDNETKLHFLNTDTVIAEDYYNQITEYHQKGIGFNHFSLITEIIHNQVVILSTGDIEKAVEKAYVDYVHKCSLMTMPHHGCNRDAFKLFYYATKPQFAIYNSSKVILNSFKSFMYLKELRTQIISSNIYETDYTSVAQNGLFSFTSNGYTLTSNARGSGIQENVLDLPCLYNEIDQLINFSTQTQETITLEDIYSNMIDGSILRLCWLASWNNIYHQLYIDILNIFPNFTSGYIIELKSIKSPEYKHIKIYNQELEFEATSRETDTWTGKKGNGLIATLSGSEELIQLLKSLPVGKYSIGYFNDKSSDILYPNGGYALDVSIISNDGTNILACVIASLRSTATYEDNRCLMASCYVNTETTPKYKWRRLI